jgi:hypothetical protein
MKGTCNGTAHARRVIRLAYQSLCELGLSYRATQRRLEEGGTRVPDGQLINWLRHVECAHRAGPSPSDPPVRWAALSLALHSHRAGPLFGDDGLQQDRDGALQRLAVRLTFILAGGGRGCPGRDRRGAGLPTRISGVLASPAAVPVRAGAHHLGDGWVLGC